jgi:hypothetical protein
MPLKRVTPSFTVEYRQARRPNSGSAKSGWAHAKPAPAGLDEKANRIAISAFKTVAAKPLADVISPSVPSGRILPSLVEAAPMAGEADTGGAQPRNYRGAAQAGHAARVPRDGTAAHPLGEHVYPAEPLEPSIGFALAAASSSARTSTSMSRRCFGVVVSAASRFGGPPCLRPYRRSALKSRRRPRRVRSGRAPGGR